MHKNRQMRGQDISWNFSEAAERGAIVLVIGEQCHIG